MEDFVFHNDISGPMFREFVNEDIPKNIPRFNEYSEFARKLNAKEIDLEINPFMTACLHQPYNNRKEYNHVDAYFFSHILSEFFQGNILFGILRTDSKARKDKDRSGNNETLTSAQPIFGHFDQYQSSFVGGQGFCDGYLMFEGEMKFTNHKGEEEYLKEFSGLLEVGFTDISTSYVHLFLNKGQLARFPYGHSMIGLFVKKNFHKTFVSLMNRL